MKASPLRLGLFVAGAWLTTLGACGRTLPMTDDTYGYGAVSDQGDDDTASGGTGNGASVGGSHTGGSSNGGTGAKGGTGNGGTRANGGTGALVDGGGTGGSGFGGTGGDIAPFGGTGDRGSGGTVSRGGRSAGGRPGAGFGAGGRSAAGNGGKGGIGGTSGMGGDLNMAGAAGFPDITCDAMTCDPATTVCCKRRGSPSTCESIDTGCTSGATLACSGSGQCAEGQVCCFHFNASTCADSCDVSVGSPGNPPTIVLCDSDADCASDEICVIAPRGIAYCAATAG